LLFVGAQRRIKRFAVGDSGGVAANLNDLLEGVIDTIDLGVAANQARESHSDLDASNAKRLLFHSIRIRRKTEQNHLLEES